MKKLTAVLMTAVLMVTFLAGCGKKRELFNNIDLSEYISVGNYKGIEIDTTSEEFAKYYKNILGEDVKENGFYDKADVVEDGYTVVIDYTGKIDGVAFDDGTATNADLVIGSGTFISGFEEGLIGAVTGETRDVAAKFPDDYGKEELNGKDAVFTCVVNEIKKPWDEERIYKELNFASVDNYIADLTKRAAKSYLLNSVCSSASILSLPEDNQEEILDAMYLEYVEMSKQEGIDFNTVLESNNLTVDSYKQRLLSNGSYTQFVGVGMVMYYILDAEGLEIYESTLNSQETTQPIISECYAVQDIVLDYLYENAVIK